MLRILVSVAALALTLDLVVGSALSEAWAKGPGGHVTTSGITHFGNAQGSTGASSSAEVQARKKSSGDKPLKYMKFKMNDVFISH